MPNEQPPLVYVCASAQDHVFVEMVGGRLRARGLEPRAGGELGDPAAIDVRQRAIEAAAAVLVVVSGASARSPVVAANYRHALSRGKPVVPLIVVSARDLPRDLEGVQSADFSRSQDVGWQSLLIALDSLGIARYPALPIPDLDIELALARIQSGRVPPSWTVSRITVADWRHLSRATLYGWAVTLALTALAFLATDHEPLVLLAGAYTLYELYAKFSPPVLRLDRRAPAVVITPAGVVVQTAKGAAVWAAWREATVEIPPADQPVGANAVLLQARPLGGQRAMSMSLGKLLAGDLLSEQAMRSYVAYVAAYQPGQASARLASLMPALPAPILISYSRRDAAFVDRLDLTLQQSGYRTWVDRSDLVGGTEWSRELEQALDQCAAAVVVASPAAMRSSFVRREYRYALQAGKPVVALLARSTRRIPAELRPLLRADCREALILGLLDLSLALDDAGIRPSLSGRPGRAALAAGAMPILARALRGQVAPGGQVYRGRLPLRLALAPLTLLLAAAVPLALYLSSGSVYFLTLIGACLLGFVPPLLLFVRRRLRYPDTIVALPEGYITFTGSARAQEHPFASLGAVSIGPASLRQGLSLVNRPSGGDKPYTVWIPRTFRAHRRIAGRIVADFARYQQERGAGTTAQGWQAPGARDAGE